MAQNYEQPTGQGPLARVRVFAEDHPRVVEIGVAAAILGITYLIWVRNGGGFGSLGQGGSSSAPSSGDIAGGAGSSGVGATTGSSGSSGGIGPDFSGITNTLNQIQSAIQGLQIQQAVQQFMQPDPAKGPIVDPTGITSPYPGYNPATWGNAPLTSDPTDVRNWTTFKVGRIPGATVTNVGDAPIVGISRIGTLFRRSQQSVSSIVPNAFLINPSRPADNPTAVLAPYVPPTQRKVY